MSQLLMRNMHLLYPTAAARDLKKCALLKGILVKDVVREALEEYVERHRADIDNMVITE